MLEKDFFWWEKFNFRKNKIENATEKKDETKKEKKNWRCFTERDEKKKWKRRLKRDMKVLQRWKEKKSFFFFLKKVFGNNKKKGE